jgi:hypothetical protein
MKHFPKFLFFAISVIISCDNDEKLIVEPGESSYFPLQVGYQWEYEPIRTDLPYLTAATFTVISQETKFGKTYFAMERRFERQNGFLSSDTIFYRVDSEGFVFELSGSDEVERNRFRLGANQGDTWEMESGAEQKYVVTTSISDVTLAGGVLSDCKSFSYDIPQWADEEHYIILAQGIGIVQHGNAWGFDFKLKRAQLGAITL